LITVRKEAEALLDAANQAEEEKAQKQKVEEAKKANTTSSKKRKSMDRSTLPPEERLRREEQRRLQKEAAERRARGQEVVLTKHAHPLNSERRRANRRKPKWERTYSSSANNRDLKKEHHMSGFEHRKVLNKKQRTF
jgi:hypothetical protein